MSDHNRKMEITWKTTPSELRVIAIALERDGCRQVRVNWYHTRLCFVLDEAKKECVANTDLEGDVHGRIIPEDLDEKAQCEIIDAAQYLNDKGIRDIINYLRSLAESRAPKPNAK